MNSRKKYEMEGQIGKTVVNGLILSWKVPINALSREILCDISVPLTNRLYRNCGDRNDEMLCILQYRYGDESYEAPNA